MTPDPTVGPNPPGWSLVPYGDRALLVELVDVDLAHRVAAVVEGALRAGRVPFAVDDVVVGLGNVVIHLGQRPTAGPAVAWTAGLVSGVLGDRGRPAPPDRGTPGTRAPPPLEIPVEFDGPDLAEVAAAIGTTPEGVALLLTGTDLRVAFLGFSPGFPYLIGLPEPLAAVRRRPSPRPMVPAGSVAVASGFASVYPQSTPGGWMLLGHTSVQLFDPEKPPYALLRAGDRVRFRAAGSAGRHAGGAPLEDGPGKRAPLTAGGHRWAEVERPGFLSLLQDEGRRSVAAMGVPRAGPADPQSFTLANRLVGNADGATSLEITVSGPALRFAGPAHVAVVASAADSAEVTVDGLPCPDGAVIPVGPGQVVEIGRVRVGLRAYLAVAGGFDTPRTVGSRSSDVLVGLGPGPLTAGDRLGLGRPTRPHGVLTHPGSRDTPTAPVIRVVAGPHPMGGAAWEHLTTRPWTVAVDSNRVGVRLTGRDPLPVDGSPSIPSTGMVTGAIQVPPDGHPIVLMPDHATVGGYPVIGCVISADLAALGQLSPGDTVRFTAVDLEEAGRIASTGERVLGTRVSGWYPTEAGT